MLSLMQSLSMIQWFYKRYLSMNDYYKGVSKFLNAEIVTQLLKTKKIQIWLRKNFATILSAPLTNDFNDIISASSSI